MMPRAHSFGVWLLAIAIALAAALGLAADPPKVGAGVSASGSASAAVSAGNGSGTGAAAVHGMAPMPNDQKVPTQWLPPGAFADDEGPSDVVFPTQQITLRFNHKWHTQDPNGPKLKCDTCHKGATTSESVNDKLTPPGTVCDSCHMSDHTDPNKVTPGDDEEGKCAFCHLGYKDGDGNKTARFELPRANMVFNHKKHVTRNIGCQQCHGAVQELELATRDQMPRMRGCFGCHQMPDAAARGQARSDCLNCHLHTSGGQKESLGGRMRTSFPQGKLLPPRWLKNAAHTPDWIQRHKHIAGNDSQFCSNCHKEDFCVECHDGRVRPRSIHPSDYISMHPIEARQQTQKCTSCHREQSFCITCHQRLGITMSGPADVRMSGRFHPPKDIWSDAPRKPGHHSFEANRNLNACVSCHIERDCVICHGGAGIGAGFNPHMRGFAGGCATQFRRNPRPCYVCHDPGAGVLNQCR